MAYIDEKIALLEREARQQEAEEAATHNKQANQDRQEKRITLEEMLKAVREGTVTLFTGEKYAFTVRTVLEERLPMALIKDIYTGVQENEGVAIFVNHDQGISQILTLADKPMGEESIGKWKLRLEGSMQQVGAYAEVTAEKALENLDYLIFRTPTGNGWIHNLIFRIRTGSGRVVGNYNCYEKDKNTYGVMLEALVLHMNELLSEGRWES